MIKISENRVNFLSLERKLCDRAEISFEIFMLWYLEWYEISRKWFRKNVHCLYVCVYVRQSSKKNESRVIRDPLFVLALALDRIGFVICFGMNTESSRIHYSFRDEYWIESNSSIRQFCSDQHVILHTYFRHIVLHDNKKNAIYRILWQDVTP